MAIKPYVSQSKVTPIAGVDTSGINRVANIQANSMLGAARVLDTIGEMAFQEGKKERIIEGTLDAAYTATRPPLPPPLSPCWPCRQLAE